MPIGFARLPCIWLMALLWSVALPLKAQPAPAQSGFTAEEQVWLRQHPVLRVVSDAASPPFDFLDAQGERRGLYADYLAALLQPLGVRVEWSPENRRERLVPMARAGEADLVALFGLAAPGADFVPVRRALARDYPVLVVRRTGGGFESPRADGQRVSEVRAYGPAQDHAARQRARQFLGSEAFETALVDVAVGRTDLSVLPLAVAEYLIRQRGLAGLRIAGPYTGATSPAASDGFGPGTDQFWWVPTAASPWAGILEKAWDQLPAEQHQALRARWLEPLMPDPLASTAPAPAPSALWWGSAAVVGLLLLALGWQWRRHREQQRRSRERLQHLADVVERSPGLLFEMQQEPDGTVVVRYASPEARRLFAIDIEEESLPIDAFLRNMHADDQPAVVAAIRRSAELRTPIEQAYRLQTPTGLRWMKSIIHPQGSDRRRPRWSGLTVDISAQKEAELRAEEAERELREITNNLPGVVFQFQRNISGSYQLNFASAGLTAMRGVRAEDFNRDGDAFFSSIVEEDRDRVRNALDYSAVTLEALAVEYRVRMDDGRIEWISNQSHPVQNREGQVVWTGYLSNVSRLKAIEQELQHAQRFLRELTDGIPGFIYQMRREAPDAPYRGTFVSAGVTSHGVAVAEVMADISRIYQSIYPEDVERVRTALDRSYTSLVPLRAEYRLRLPSGLTAWMRTQAMPARQPSGVVVWNGMTINISEEKLRELQAQRAEERLARITDALPGVAFQMVATQLSDVSYTYVSNGAREMLQLEPEAILRDARLVTEQFFAEDQRRSEAAFVESAVSGKPVQLTYRFRRRDNSVRWLRSVAIPQPSENGTHVWNGFVQDITDQSEAEGRAQLLQQRLVEVTENVPCTVFQLQRDFEDELSVRFVSENLYALLGITREDVMQDITTLVDRIVPDDLVRMMQALDTAHTEQRPVFFDIRIRDTAGMLRWVRGSVSTPRVEDGGLLWNGAWLDITDIKELESNLAAASQVAEVANRMKSEFLATMSHEIRTPMNAIIGLGQLLQSTPLNTHQRGYLDKINTASQSLLGILNDILDLSKIEAGKMSVERTEFDLNAVLDNLCAMTHLKAAEKELELRFEVPTTLPMRLMGDPLRLGQVLLNLTSNAIKFSERGQVVVRVSEGSRDATGLRLVFEVIDEGIGLTPDQIDRLFNSFAQGDASTTRKYGGTGLGLSISRNLVRLMDGEISVVSEPGHGSTFRFDALVGLPPEPQPRYDLPRDLFGLHALVVDDNVATCSAMAGWLAAFGFTVSEALSGEAALQQIQSGEHPFALVVLDWRMPDLNGAEVAERIRALPLPQQPAVLMASAYVNEPMVRRLEGSVRDFLAKPFSPSALFKTVLAALGRQESGQATAAVAPLLTGLRVLVADDNEINLEIAQQMLESAGASVRLARDGEEALGWLGRADFDVALLDIQMPKLDGLEVARRLREAPRLPLPGLIALTAQAQPEQREASQLAGFDSHLLKPIDRNELLETLLRYRRLEPTALSPTLLVVGGEVSTPARDDPAAFDRVAALNRLGGNVPLLERLLSRFISDHTHSAQTILAAIDAGDLETATREAHSLKGVAANLGAARLAATAGALEAALRRGEIVEDTQLALLRIHHQETLQVMQVQALAAVSDASAAPPPAVAALQVARLQGLLVAHDADAKDAFDALEQSLAGARPTALLRLRSAVENYDFDEALVALRDVLRDLNLE